MSNHRHSPKAQSALCAAYPKPVTSPKKVVERARRHEAAYLTGTVNVTALSYTQVPNRSAAHQLNSPRHQRRQIGRRQGGTDATKLTGNSALPGKGLTASPVMRRRSRPLYI